FISTSAISEATRLSLAKLQAKLADAQKEVSTSRLADVGASLGYKTGQSVSLRQDHARLSGIIDANSAVTTRLDATQAGLKQLVGNAQAFVSQLPAARNAETAPPVPQQQAQLGFRPFSTPSIRPATAPTCSPASTPIRSRSPTIMRPVPAIARPWP